MSLFLRLRVKNWNWKTSGTGKPLPHDLVRRIGFWRTKSPEQDLKYLY